MVNTTKRPYCRCLYEIENKLPMTKHCFMPCADQDNIMQQREESGDNVQIKENKNMKPTIGRIVIYKTTEKERQHMRFNSEAGISQNVQNELPAIIVAVWSDTCINVKVLVDGFGTDLWRTSINQGDDEGHWNWPKIITDSQDNSNPGGIR